MTSGAKAIPEPANGLDQISRRAKLRAQALDVHVHGAGLDVRRRFPYGLEQVATRLHSSPSFGEHDEQAVLRGRKLDVVPVHRNTVRASIDLERANAQHVGRRLWRLGDASQDRPDAQHELLWAERLRQIVVRAER